MLIQWPSIRFNTDETQMHQQSINVNKVARDSNGNGIIAVMTCVKTITEREGLGN